MSALSAGEVYIRTRKADGRQRLPTVHALSENRCETPIVMLHGFSEGPEIWIPLAGELAAKNPVFLAELPGHGNSKLSAHEDYAFSRQAEVLMHALQPHLSRRPPAILIGYSMGGRLALAMATAHPQAFLALCLISVHPGLATAEERDERRIEDGKWSLLCRSDRQQFSAAWDERPIFKDIAPEVRAFRASVRERHSPDHLALSLEGAGLGEQPDYRTVLGTLPLALNLITGTKDEKFTHLAVELKQIRPDARHVIIPAGHAVHAEEPRLLQKTLGLFIDEYKTNAHAQTFSSTGD